MKIDSSKNNAVSFLVALRAGVKYTKKLVLSTESKQVNWPPGSGFKAYLSRANPSLIVFLIQHFLLRPICSKIESNLHVRPPLVSDHLSNTPNVTHTVETRP